MFDTEVECQNKCDLNYNNDTPTKLVDVCSLEIDPGPCRGTLWYYGFNKNSKRCEKFFYGGKYKYVYIYSTFHRCEVYFLFRSFQQA